jgi:hypothetical protein
MKNQLNKLSAGPDFAEYLIANGWVLHNLKVSNGLEEATFEKQGQNGTRRLVYQCHDMASEFTCLFKLNGPVDTFTTTQFVVTGTAEENIDQFACLCHAMGWVTFQEANLNCQAHTGQSLADFMASIFTSPKAVSNQIFNKAVALCEAEK